MKLTWRGFWSYAVLGTLLPLLLFALVYLIGWYRSPWWQPQDIVQELIY